VKTLKILPKKYFLTERPLLLESKCPFCRVKTVHVKAISDVIETLSSLPSSSHESPGNEVERHHKVHIFKNVRSARERYKIV
jgi:hypothetical protein